MSIDARIKAIAAKIAQGAKDAEQDVIARYELEKNKFEEAVHAFLDHIEGVYKSNADSALHNVGDVAGDIATDVGDAAHNITDVAENTANAVKAETNNLQK